MTSEAVDQVATECTRRWGSPCVQSVDGEVRVAMWRVSDYARGRVILSEHSDGSVYIDGALPSEWGHGLGVQAYAGADIRERVSWAAGTAMRSGR